MGRIGLVIGLSFVFSGWSPGREVLAANEYANLANHIATSLQCARLIIARNQDVINTHGAKVGEPIPEGAPSSCKGLVPAIFGRLVADEFMVRTGVTIKQTTLGKGRGPRNVYNAPDPWEKAALEKF
ncbi:MAG TPA: c-type heme family protein, partial [Candidatus Hypogeohydataceae bacterium YC38]